LTRVVGIFAFILLSPLLVVVGLIILIDDGFPVLYRQKRIGVNNSKFMIYKFRTMRKDTPDIPTNLFKDPTSFYTKSSPLMRKLSLDELPQLLNIIKGEMNFVGPRPALHNQDDLISLRTSIGVHQLKPGVTGWAQVNGRDDLSIPQKVIYDKYYLHNRSLFLNVKIIVLTAFKVLGMKGVSH